MLVREVTARATMAFWATDSTLVMTTRHTLPCQTTASTGVARGHHLSLGAHGGKAHDIWAEHAVLSTKLSSGTLDDALDLQIWVHAIRATMTLSWLY